MGNSTLIRATLLVALILAFGLAATGTAPAADQLLFRAKLGRARCKVEPGSAATATPLAVRSPRASANRW